MNSNEIPSHLYKPKPPSWAKQKSHFIQKGSTWYPQFDAKTSSERHV